MDPFVARMIHTIRREGMLAPGDAVLAGVSAGPDSTALVAALAEAAGLLGITVAVAHVNHGLRPGADADEAAAAALAARLGLKFMAHRLEAAPAGNLEAWAREERYRALFRLAEDWGAGKVAVGHHADDAAETFLINLLRGAGAAGLGGIAPVRKAGTDHPGLSLIRPLIRQDRREVLAFLARRRLDFRDDPTNRDPGRLRNRVRHQLLPQLEAINPRIRQTLARTAQSARLESEFVRGLADAWLGEHARPGPDGFSLKLGPLRLAPAGLRFAIYRDAIQALAGSLDRIAFAHLDALDRIAFESSPHAHLDLPGLAADRGYDHLQLQMSAPSGAGNASRDLSPSILPVPGELSWPASSGPAWLIRSELGPRPAGPADPRAQAWIDPERVSLPLTVRPRRPGDRYHPFGPGGSRKVKDIMIDLKVPSSDRACWPLICDRDRILWVPGIRPAEPAPDPPAPVIVIRATR